MNKTKQQLYEENLKLKKEQKIYREFWETDAIEWIWKSYRGITTIFLIISIVLLIISILIILNGGE